MIPSFLLQVPPGEDQNLWWHWTNIVIPVILSTTGLHLLAYFANRKRGNEKDRKRREQQLQDENRLTVLLENYRLHEHSEWRGPESVGPLNAEGIRFARRGGDR